jgi:O-antigen biosynthesis protein
MRIAVLAIYVRGADAIGLQLNEWVRMLRNDQHTVRVFVESIGPATPPDIRALTSVHTEQSVRQSDDWEYITCADLVICDYPAYFGLADCLRLLERPAILFHYHGVTQPDLWSDPVGRAFLERSRRRASLVHFADLAVCHSEFSRQELHQLSGYPLDRIRVLPYIVPAPPLHGSADRRHGSAPIILYVGRLAAHKRPHLLVEALALVRLRSPSARLVLVGDAHGPSHAPVLAQMRALAVAHGIEDAVHFTGAVDNTLLGYLYGQAQVFVTASAHEGFCIPVIEAMAHGVPVVVNAVGALPETAGDAGVMVPDGDVPALAEAIIDLIESSDNRSLLIERGYARAQTCTLASLESRVLDLIGAIPRRQRRARGVPRLMQSIDLAAIDAAAEVGSDLPGPAGRIPIISRAAIRLRRWLTSDVERRLDAVLQRQVMYNRQVAQALHELDELSADISEQLAGHTGEQKD